MQQARPAPGVQSPQSFSLAELHQLPLDARFAWILEAGRDDLIATVKAVRDAHDLLPTAFSIEHLAWAVAFNVDGAPTSPSDAPTARRGIRSYGDRWPGETTWAAIWAVMVNPLPPDKAGRVSTLLGELAWSVACEHREDWQNPRTAPIDGAEADRAFEWVYAQNRAKIVRDVSRSFGRLADSPEAIADEAWSRVFCDYWSPAARRRFLGLSRISTLVCQVARYIAIDAIRDRGYPDAEAMSTGTEFPRRGASPIELGITIDPSADLQGAELQRKIKKCMSALPARQRLVSEVVWFRQVSARRAAEILKISEAAVSQHLKKARAALAQCLGR